MPDNLLNTFVAAMFAMQTGPTRGSSMRRRLTIRGGLVPSPNAAAQAVSSRVSEFVDQFICAYRSVNPKS